MLKKLLIENFKSYKHAEIEFANLAVFIGTNASGKSSFLEAIKFVKDIQENGLEDAISMHGGKENILNKTLKESKPLRIKCAFEINNKLIINEDKKYRGNTKGKTLGFKTKLLEFEFSIQFNKSNQTYLLKENRIKINFEIVDLDTSNKKRVEEKKVLYTGNFEINTNTPSNKISIKVPEDIHIHEFIKEITESLMFGINNRPQIGKLTNGYSTDRLNERLLIENPFIKYSIIFRSSDWFDSIGFYNINPDNAKKVAVFTGRSKLEEDGANLALLLNSIFKNKRDKDNFILKLKFLLPFVKDCKPKKVLDKSVMINIIEYDKNIIPSYFVSDGTITVIALLIALFFEKKTLCIIEEPERNLHPALIRKLLALVEEKKSKQIFLTTHSPFFINLVPPKNLFYISKDDKGFSTIDNVGNNKTTQVLLKNKIGVGDLFVENALE